VVEVEEGQVYRQMEVVVDLVVAEHTVALEVVAPPDKEIMVVAAVVAHPRDTLLEVEAGPGP
jgi:hypothetical protein